MSNGIDLFPPSDTPNIPNGATQAEIKKAVVIWFKHNFEDPVHEPPYDSREGGYQYVWGKFEPIEVINACFSESLSEKLIDDVVRELEGELLVWVPASWRIRPDEDYSETADISQAHEAVQDALEKLKAALSELPSTSMLGHNNPPLDADVQPYTDRDRDELTQIIVFLQQQPTVPDETNPLQETKGKLEAFHKKISNYLAIQGDIIISAASKTLGDRIGGKVFLNLANELLPKLIEAITRWINLLL